MGEKIKIKLKGNCRNHWEMEGYAENIQKKLSDKGQMELTFKLTSLHTKIGDKITHKTPIKVVLRNKQMEVVSTWLKPMMLVLCEGNYQLGKSGKAVMACQRVTPNEPYMVEDDYELAKESEEDNRGNN